ARFEEAADDALLVVRGDVDRDERVVAEDEVARVALARDCDASLAALLAVAEQPRRRRREDDDRRQVVADRVAEEDAAGEQRQRREDHADPADYVMRLVD